MSIGNVPMSHESVEEFGASLTFLMRLVLENTTAPNYRDMLIAVNEVNIKYPKVMRTLHEGAMD